MTAGHAVRCVQCQITERSRELSCAQISHWGQTTGGLIENERKTLFSLHHQIGTDPALQSKKEANRTATVRKFKDPLGLFDGHEIDPNVAAPVARFWIMARH